MADTPPQTPDASQAAPKELVERAYLLLSEFVGDELSPEITALLTEEFEATARAAKELTLREIANQFGIPVSPRDFPVDPAVREWAAQYTAELVTQVTEATKRGMAQTIADGVWKRKGVPGTARDLKPQLIADDVAEKLGKFAGLDSNRVRSALKYEGALIAEGKTPEQVSKGLDRFVAKQRTKRAQTVAATEMHRAVGAARAQSERDMGSTEKKWQSSGDDKVCDLCLGNDAAGWIPINSKFPGGVGENPQHPDCRCNVAYRGVDAEGLKSLLAAQGITEESVL